MAETRPDANPGTTTTVLVSSLASIALAVGLYLTGSKKGGIFVGLWAPTILGIGIYLNSDRTLQALANNPSFSLEAK